MARSPQWKVYDTHGSYEGCAWSIELAGAMVSFLGEGATIRYEHRITVWTEGQEGQPASGSYDHVGEVAHSRLSPHLSRAAHHGESKEGAK